LEWILIERQPPTTGSVRISQPTGTNAWHNALEAVYRELPADVSLDRVSEALEAREHVRTPTSWEMAVTDMIHWLRRLRGRLLRCEEKGERLEGRDWHIEPEEVARLADIVPILGKPGAAVECIDTATTDAAWFTVLFGEIKAARGDDLGGSARAALGALDEVRSNGGGAGRGRGRHSSSTAVRISASFSTAF
jgi:hypothetical protein